MVYKATKWLPSASDYKKFSNTSKVSPSSLSFRIFSMRASLARTPSPIFHLEVHIWSFLADVLLLRANCCLVGVNQGQSP